MLNDVRRHLTTPEIVAAGREAFIRSSSSPDGDAGKPTTVRRRGRF
jgi:hypothetical protein